MDHKQPKQIKRYAWKKNSQKKKKRRKISTKVARQKIKESRVFYSRFVETITKDRDGKLLKKIGEMDQTNIK